MANKELLHLIIPSKNLSFLIKLHSSDKIENWKKVGNGAYQPLGFLFLWGSLWWLCSLGLHEISSSWEYKRWQESFQVIFSTDEINLRALRGDHTFECGRARSRSQASGPLSEALNYSILPKWSMNLNLPMKALYPGDQGAVYLEDCFNFVPPWLPTSMGKRASCELISLDREIIYHPSPKNTSWVKLYVQCLQWYPLVIWSS